MLWHQCETTAVANKCMSVHIKKNIHMLLFFFPKSDMHGFHLFFFLSPQRECHIFFLFTWPDQHICQLMSSHSTLSHKKKIIIWRTGPCLYIPAVLRLVKWHEIFYSIFSQKRRDRGIATRLTERTPLACLLACLLVCLFACLFAFLFACLFACLICLFFFLDLGTLLKEKGEYWWSSTKEGEK